MSERVSIDSSLPRVNYEELLSDVIGEIQRKSLYGALILIGVTSLVLLGTFIKPFDQPIFFITSMVVLALTIGFYFLQRVNYAYTAILVVLVSTGLLLELIFLGGMPELIILFSIPIGLFTLLISIPGGIVYAAIFSIVVLLPVPALSISVTIRLASLFAVWSSVGLLALAMRPLLIAVRWSWEGFERNRQLLSQAREFQVRLQETLSDLSAANMQLTRLNKQVEGLNLQAEEARLVKEQFVANISHELRTPINMIIGYCEMIIDTPEMYGKNLPPTLLSDLDVIYRNSQHLSSLINDVLDLSQLETSQMALNREKANLRNIIESAVIAIQPLFVSKKLALDVEVSEDLPSIYCDVTRVREVLLNLLSNSGRFTDQGGVTVKAYQQDNRVVVSVNDTGPGIAEKDKERLFQPFQQLDGSIRRRYGGSGLGLSISKKFVEMHDGQMWLESIPGKGTTFYFSLPIMPITIDSNAARWITPGWDLVVRTHPSLIPVPSVRARFVLVDPDRSLSTILDRYMDEVECITVSNMDEALDELNRLPSQALLVNTLQSFEVMEEIMESDKLPENIPLILTNVPSSDTASNRLGVNAYITKPISVKALGSKIAKMNLIGKNILIVDDDIEELRLYWRVLSQMGKQYKVMTAENGSQALEILRKKQVDLLIMDLMMPDMDGYHLLQIRSQEPKLRQIPTIIVSALDPLGHPLISHQLTVTRKGGISIPQLLRSIETITQIMGPKMRLDDQATEVKTSG